MKHIKEFTWEGILIFSAVYIAINLHLPTGVQLIRSYFPQQIHMHSYIERMWLP